MTYANARNRNNRENGMNLHTNTSGTAPKALLTNAITGLAWDGVGFNADLRSPKQSRQIQLETPARAAFIKSTYANVKETWFNTEPERCLRCGAILNTDEGTETGVCADCWTPADEEN